MVTIHARIYIAGAKLRGVWKNMLQMLPGVSEERATHFAQRHSCPRALYRHVHSMTSRKAGSDAATDGGDDHDEHMGEGSKGPKGANELMFQFDFNKTSSTSSSSGGPRASQPPGTGLQGGKWKQVSQKKLSKAVYAMVTQCNPLASINDIGD